MNSYVMGGHAFALNYIREWLRKFHIAKRAYMCGACARVDAINALECLGYSFLAAALEVRDWARERNSVRPEPVLILAFDGEEEVNHHG